MRYLKKLAKMCRSCPNFDACPHKKMEAERHLPVVQTTTITPAITDGTDKVLISLYPNLTPVEMEGLKEELKKEAYKLNKSLIPEFFIKKFNVR